ncbi:hypothetical protein D9M69_522100 [compost metagenome]
MGFDPAAEGVVVGDEAFAPAFGLMQRGGFGGRHGVLLGQRLLHGLEHLGVEGAHELADELHLAALALEIGDAFRLGDGIDQFLAQREGVEQAGTQGEQFFAQFLQFGALALEFGAAGFVGAALELALELQVEFAAFGNEVATDEIAFFGFAGHGVDSGPRRAALQRAQGARKGKRETGGASIIATT